MPVVTRSMAKRARPEDTDASDEVVMEPPLKKQKVSRAKKPVKSKKKPAAASKPKKAAPKKKAAAKKKAEPKKKAPPKKRGRPKKKKDEPVPTDEQKELEEEEANTEPVPDLESSENEASNKPTEQEQEEEEQEKAEENGAVKEKEETASAAEEDDEEEEEKKNDDAFEVGGNAPDFKDVLNEKGEKVALGDYRGQYLVIYFYPKDNTPGCTKEGKRFRDLNGDFKARNCAILGVSADKVEAHKKFVDKYEFNFSLLADTSRELINAYKAAKAGNKITRSTVLIDPNGKIAKIWNPVRGAAKHPDQVLKALQAIQDDEE